MAVQLPMPHEPMSDNPAVLMEDEQKEMAACEAAIDHLRVAFWAAGKALAVIRDGRHYRTTHATFEDYVEQRWEMSRAQAYRLIEAWPLAERLGVSPIGDTGLTESQVRALLPVVRKHGEGAAFEVYRAVAEADGMRVTAQLLSDAVRAVPADGSGVAEAVEVWLASLAEDRQEDGGQEEGQSGGGRTPSAVEELAAAVERLRPILRRAVAEDAEAVRRILAGLPVQGGPPAVEAARH
jgi:hypothetical protein